MTAEGLQLVPGAQLHQLALQTRQPAHLTGKVGQPLGEGRQQLRELADLLQQFRQQQLAQKPTHQQQRHQHHHQGGGPVQRQQAPQKCDRHVKGHGQHHRAKQHEQHPAQLPAEQPQHDQGQRPQYRAAVHGVRVPAVGVSMDPGCRGSEGRARSPVDTPPGAGRAAGPGVRIPP